MKELLDNPGFIALVGTMFGGAGLEIIRRLMDRKQRKNDFAASQRAELRTEIEGRRKQLTDAAAEEQRLEAEIERWRGLFYDQKEEHIQLVGELQILKERLKAYQPPLPPVDELIEEGK